MGDELGKQVRAPWEEGTSTPESVRWLLALTLGAAVWTVLLIAGGQAGLVWRWYGFASLAAASSAALVVTRPRLPRDLTPFVGIVLVAIPLYGAIAYPQVRGWDAVSYHLYPVFTAAVHHRWLLYPESGDFAGGYPQGGETLFLGAYLIGGVTALSLVQIAAGVWAALGIYAGGRLVGLSRATAAVVPMLFLACPAVLGEMPTELVDVIGAAAVMTAFDGLLLGVRGSRSGWLLAGLACGIGIGVKMGDYGVPVAALAILALTRPRSEWIGGLARLVAPAALVGGFWYATAWILFGNPFGPITVGPFTGLGTIRAAVSANLTVPPPAWRALPGWELDVLSLFAYRPEGVAQYLYDTGIGGYVWFLPVALVGWAWALTGKRLDRATWLTAAAVVIAFGAVTPQLWYNRYLMPLVPVVLLGCGLLWEELEELSRKRGFGQALKAVVVAVLAGGILYGARFGVAAATEPAPPKGWSTYFYLPEYEWLLHLSGPTTVGFANPPYGFTALLYGTCACNNVVDLSVPWWEHATYTRKNFLADLAATRPQYVEVGKAPPVWWQAAQPVAAWMAAAPGYRVFTRYSDAIVYERVRAKAALPALGGYAYQRRDPA